MSRQLNTKVLIKLLLSITDNGKEQKLWRSDSAQQASEFCGGVLQQLQGLQVEHK